MAITARTQEPTVPQLTQWIDLASALMDQGLGPTEFSGMSLTEWQAVLRADDAKFLRKKFAIAAIHGVASQHLRHLLGPAAEQLTIRLSFDESVHCS